MMLETTHALIRRVGEKMGLGEKQVDQLLTLDALHSFDITLNNGKTFQAFRAQHKNVHGPYKGGIRFHPSVDSSEVAALATLMSLKTALLGLPLGGGKGGINVDPRELTDDEIEEISRKYVQLLHPHIGPNKDVPAPDVNTDPRIIDWMVDEYEQLTGDTSKASFTGKSISNFGSQGRSAATGRGGAIVLIELLKHTLPADKKLRIAIQGFGNVGSFFAKTIAQLCPRWKIVAVSDSQATLSKKTGLDVASLLEYKSAKGRFKDYKDNSVTIASAETIISSDCDVLVLAALDGAVHLGNMKQVQATHLLELANGPITDEAFMWLSAEGKTVIPDIIANAGGVVVSYLEWLQNKQAQHWTEEYVNRLLDRYMKEATDNVYKIAKRERISLKEAAFTIAIERLVFD